MGVLVREGKKEEKKEGESLEEGGKEKLHEVGSWHESYSW